MTDQYQVRYEEAILPAYCARIIKVRSQGLLIGRITQSRPGNLFMYTPKGHGKAKGTCYMALDALKAILEGVKLDLVEVEGDEDDPDARYAFKYGATGDAVPIDRTAPLYFDTEAAAIEAAESYGVAFE